MKKTRLIQALGLAFAVTGAFAASTAVAAPDNGERFIVQFKDGRGNQGQGALAAAGAQVKLELKRHNAVAARIPAHALQGLQNNPNIEYIEDDVKRYPMSEREPGVTYGVEMVQALSVPEVVNGLKTVCIIDSGLDLAHPEFANQANISGTSDSGTGDWFTDENSHGTHVAGTVAAAANGEGVIGVNSNGTLNMHIIKVFDANGWAYSSSLTAALDRCMDAGSDVVSMSLGGSFSSKTEDRAFRDANALGVLSIAAAGNDGNTRKSYPASYASVMSVAAIDANMNIASFSQQNAEVEIAAPGVSVLSSVPRGTGSRADVVAGGATYDAQAMDGSPSGSASGTLVDCGLGDSVCAGASGAVCYIQRGSVSFADKVANCEAGGGVAAVIYNNEPGALLGTLGGAATGIVSVGISDTDGAALGASLGTTATVSNVADDYAYFDGTSMATPHVSGVAALIWNNVPECSNDDIRNAMNATALDLGDPGRDNAYGYGLVQAADALAYLGTDCGGGGGSEPPPPGQCTLGQVGDACSTGSDCCSGSCKGKPGAKTCK